MKIYSLIDEKKTGNQEEIFDREQYTFNQIPNRNSNGSVFAEKSQRSSKDKSKNKFSFRLQPQLYFQKKRNNLEQLYEAVNHISIVDSEDDKKIQMQQRRLSPYNRKKIFDGSAPITKLNLQYIANFPQTVEKVQAKSSRIQLPLQNNPVIEPARQMTNRNANLPNLSNFPLSTIIGSMSHQRQQIKIGQKINFDHPQSEVILQNPILQEPIGEKSKNSQINQNIERIIREYPRLIEKVESTQKQLKQLSKKIDSKAEEQKKAIDLLQKTIQEKNFANLQKDKEIYQYKKYIGNLTQQNLNKKLKAQLQIEQNKRLQHLIQQNKFLCSKVIEQQQHRALKQEEEEINRRINELRQQRNNKYQQIFSKNHNKELKQTLVPFHNLDQKPFNRIRNPGSSSITFSQRPSTFDPNHNAMPIPERDFGEQSQKTRIRTRQIPFSRIY